MTTQLKVKDNDRHSTFMLQRKLGHKLEIPQAGQWEIIMDQSKEEDTKTDYPLPSKIAPKSQQQECWYCNNHHLTIIFWSPMIEFIVQKKQE